MQLFDLTTQRVVSTAKAEARQRSAVKKPSLRFTRFQATCKSNEQFHILAGENKAGFQIKEAFMLQADVGAVGVCSGVSKAQLFSTSDCNSQFGARVFWKKNKRRRNMLDNVLMPF